MKYRRLGRTEAEISVLSLGGHEYLPNKKSRGFNEDFKKAITPGYIFEGFGGEDRKKILKTAFENGINFLDVTHDSEKEALGRNLKEIVPPFPVYVQTRPEGFVYTYDKNNERMAKYEELKKEVLRILKLLGRERIEFFNFAFMKEALDNDPDYIQKINYNIEALKREGLIQYACADTFSGEYTYLQQIVNGSFDTIYLNFNFGDYGAIEKVLPEVREKGLGFISREAFMKGALFEMAREAGIADKEVLAQAALKWCLSFNEVTTVVYGTGNVEHLKSAVRIVDEPFLSENETSLIEAVKATAQFKEFEKKKTEEFFQ
ncbi:aldo/keto reductase [Marispirochaeta aestuarii]|uniref:aldo/keto reductase n=1 Tax=Marispirochaeta aestuarii TaxID=1963862 RepID=UPI002ABDF855|nr:aldo/keto reductase [Marispirochaeta aestuarii]